MIRTVQINNIEVWLFIQKLTAYVSEGVTLNLVETNEYLCYYKLSPPTEIIFGELIRDERKNPKLFTSPEEAEVYAIKFLGRKLNYQEGNLIADIRVP